jgi:hypothetical protein
VLDPICVKAFEDKHRAILARRSESESLRTPKEWVSASPSFIVWSVNPSLVDQLPFE